MNPERRQSALVLDHDRWKAPRLLRTALAGLLALWLVRPPTAALLLVRAAQAAPGPLAKEAKAAAPKSALTLYHLPESADHRGTGRQPGARHKGDHHHGRRDRMMHGENDGVHVRYSVLESEFGVRALSQGRSTTGCADCSPLR
jgi:hypothetical protein